LIETGIGAASLLRFNLDIIDDRGNLLLRPSPHPDAEGPEELLIALLGDIFREWRAPDHIFSREAYQRAGGFVAFPKALCSDHASWALLSNPGGVRTIPGPRVLWRNHEGGLSTGQLGVDRKAQITALIQYMKWVQDYAARNPNFDKTRITRISRRHYVKELGKLQPPLSFAEALRLAIPSAAIWKRSPTWFFVALGYRALRSRAKRWPLLRDLDRRRFQRMLARELQSRQ